MLIEITENVFVDPSEVTGIRPEVWTNGGVCEGGGWSIFGSTVTISFRNLPEVKMYGPTREGYERDGPIDYDAPRREPWEWASSLARELFIKVGDALK